MYHNPCLGVGCILWHDHFLKHGLLHRKHRVLQYSRLMTDMHKVVILAIRFVYACLHRDFLFRGIFKQIGPTLECIEKLFVFPW